MSETTAGPNSLQQPCNALLGAASDAIIAFAVVAQASHSTPSVVGQRRLTGVFAAVLTALFAFLYVVLGLDAYALVAGTAAPFVVLSVVMRVARRVNWAASPAAS